MRKKNSYSRLVQDLEEWEQVSKGIKIQLFHHAIEKGITSFHINFSKGSHITKNIGTAFSESGLSRDEVQLIGSLGEEISTANEIVLATDKILENLKTDYLDLLFIPSHLSLEESSSAIEILKSQGKIFERGLFLKNFEPEKPQNELTLNARIRQVLTTSAALKLLNNMKGYSKDTAEMLLLKNEEAYDFPELLKEMSTKYDLLPRQFVISWLLQHPADFHAVIKGKSEDSIDEAHKALRTTIINEDWQKTAANL